MMLGETICADDSAAMFCKALSLEAWSCRKKKAVARVSHEVEPLLNPALLAKPSGSCCAKTASRSRFNQHIYIRLD